MTAKEETVCPLILVSQRLPGYRPGSQEETRWRLPQAAQMRMRTKTKLIYHRLQR